MSDFTPETDHEIKNLKKTVQEVKSLNGKFFLSTSKIDAAKRESFLDALSNEFETEKHYCKKFRVWWLLQGFRGNTTFTLIDL